MSSLALQRVPPTGAALRRTSGDGRESPPTIESDCPSSPANVDDVFGSSCLLPPSCPPKPPRRSGGRRSSLENIMESSETSKVAGVEKGTVGVLPWQSKQPQLDSFSPSSPQRSSVPSSPSKSPSAKSSALFQVQNLFQRRRRTTSSYRPSFASRGSSSTGTLSTELSSSSSEGLRGRSILDGQMRRASSNGEIYDARQPVMLRSHASASELPYSATKISSSIENLQQAGSRAGIACSETDLHLLQDRRYSEPERRSRHEERLHRLAERAQVSPSESPVSGTRFEDGVSRAAHIDQPSRVTQTVAITTSQESSSGLGGMSTTSSPTFERLTNPRGHINGSVSLSSSMSSLSTSSNTSLDGVGSSGKRVMFGPQHERTKTIKEPPTVREARQAARKFAVATRGLEAAATGNLALLQRLSSDSSGVDFGGETRDTAGSTAIHKAAENGQYECLRYLLEQCRSAKDATALADDDYRTPCMLAVENGHLECVQMLVRASEGDLEIDDHGLTLLHHAAHNGQVDILEYLLEELKGQGKYPTDVANDFGVTPAHVAAQQGNVECLRVLLEAGCDVLETDSDDLSPIDWAKQGGHTFCVHYLTIVQSCWTLHEQLESAQGKLTRMRERNASLENQLIKAKEVEQNMKLESERLKQDYERRVKEAKEDFVQLMTRLVKEVGSPAQLAQQMQGMSLGSQPLTQRVEKRRDPSLSPNSSLKLTRDLVAGNSPNRRLAPRGSSEYVPGSVLPVRERESRLDSLDISNFGLSDAEEDDCDDDDEDGRGGEEENEDQK